ncbi:MAG: carbohydrate kinase family protein [Kosmotogaceae bacterium]|nr:carbohydrate kinase family protein [Kosmotogaceae bacterium]
MKISVVGNVNMDLSAFISESGNNEENRISEMSFAIGGSASNTSIMLNRLRKSIYLQGAVGRDSFGEMALELLKREGLNTDYLSKLNGKTGFCFSAISEDGQRHLFTYRGVNEKEYTIEDGFDFYHFGGITPDQIERFLDKTGEVRFSYNPGGIVSFEKTSGVAAIAASCEVLFVNESEWNHLEQSLTVEPKEIVVTLGAKGSKIKNGPEEAAFPAKVVDTTGAGDSFIAGFLYAYLSGKDPAQCLKIGNLLASMVVSRSGASPAFAYNDVSTLASIYNLYL